MISSPIEEIKNRLDVVQVIAGYIKLQKAGANFRAVCPFHSEKKPSFFVSPARQIWHCFGCGVGGDIFKFVMQIEGIEFGDALRLLAQRTGVELKKLSPEYKEWQTERSRLHEICELTCRFFEKQLEESSTGHEAQDYLLGRGIKSESLKKWRIGYAPNVWQGLSDFLHSRVYTSEEIEKAGLALTSQKGSFYDRFRGRIIFPIFDLNSQVVGFGGRIFKTEDPAKYLNSPATLLYDKSRILYGLDKAKVEIRKKDSSILVEGYLDAIMSSQAGCENVVASSGTALTLFQLKILKRYSSNLLTAFDMDAAGDTATKKGIDLAQSQDFNIKVITMPQGQDPADIIAKNPTEWLKLADEAKSITQFYFETTFSSFSAQSAEGKREISKILLPVIKKIKNKIEVAHWLQELSKKIGIKEEVIQEEFKDTRLKKDGEKDFSGDDQLQQSVLPHKTRKEILEERIACLVIKIPQNLKMIGQDYATYFSPHIQTIFSDLREQKLASDSDFVNYLTLKAEIEEEEFDCQKEITTCLKELKNLQVKSKLDEISQNLKKAEEEKNSEKVNILLQEFNKVASQLSEI